MSQRTLLKGFFFIFQLSCFVNITNTYCLLWGGQFIFRRIPHVGSETLC